ncbi:hypothetical protein BV898_16017 [Hypsibius exemplaris]|uniref:Rad50/SbcC-type AAA domain-containing protein n=1 Tax=Hypsibius exemplaris TaxID=2072580 RepID=A0A9X6NE95_HYPEX|nr:hypothetical protein BV898_16017 [Hypsibius exemplaris]
MPAEMKCKLRAGSIKRVRLINFMCHSELTVDFGTQVSFVTGHNGSGKSAILAAIVAGLGARANATNRGGKISDLIKHGERYDYENEEVQHQLRVLLGWNMPGNGIGSP